MRTAEVREVVAQHARLAVPIDQVADDCDLYAAGLTSLTTVTLMLVLEERFNVEFSDKMLHRKTFATIRSLAAAIDELLAPATRAA